MVKLAFIHTFKTFKNNISLFFWVTAYTCLLQLWKEINGNLAMIKILLSISKKKHCLSDKGKYRPVEGLLNGEKEVKRLILLYLWYKKCRWINKLLQIWTIG